MIIGGLVLDTEALTILLSSCFVGILFFFALFVMSVKILWKYIKEYMVLFIFLSFIGFFPILLIWFLIFGVMPPILDSFFIVEQPKEYKVEILKTEFHKGKETKIVSSTKKGGKRTNFHSNIPDSYRVYLKKWYESKGDDPLIVDADTLEYTNYFKDKKFINLKCYRGFLGFRHILSEDIANKPIERIKKDESSNQDDESEELKN